MIDEKKLIRAMWDRYNGDYNNASRFYGEETEMAYRVLSDLQLTIEHMPKVGEWIPCNERLPEDGQTVLIQYEDRRNERKTMAVGWMENDYLCCWDDRITHAIDNAVAWMPLPEPYKEE